MASFLWLVLFQFLKNFQHGREQGRVGLAANTFHGFHVIAEENFHQTGEQEQEQVSKCQ